MAVSKILKDIYFGFFEKPEVYVANIIEKIQQKRNLNKNLDKSFKLTKEQKKQIKDFWKPYGGISTKWCRYYYSKNNMFDPRYIPNTLYYTKIDQYFNSRKLGWGFNDKNYYSRIFAGVPQPKTLVRKIGFLLFDENYKQITVQAALEIVKCEKEVIVKPSQESGSGRGICFFDTINNERELLDFLSNKKEQNFIVQSLVRQHPKLSEIYPKALNTIRVTTLMLDDGVHVLSSILRMGSNNSRVDNASNGGISVGINPDGKLKKYAHILYKGEQTDHHPQGFVFDGFEVPEYETIISSVRKMAQYVGNFRLVSWDMAVDENGEVLLIEANMRKGGIAIHQFNNGPLFGELTDRVMREVFGK